MIGKPMHSGTPHIDSVKKHNNQRSPYRAREDYKKPFGTRRGDRVGPSYRDRTPYDLKLLLPEKKPTDWGVIGRRALWGIAIVGAVVFVMLLAFRGARAQPVVVPSPPVDVSAPVEADSRLAIEWRYGVKRI